MSPVTTAIRYVAKPKGEAAAAAAAAGFIILQCRVKPGAAKSREGITAVRDDAVEICVAAQAREGEANKAVLAVLSEVSVAGPDKPDAIRIRGLTQSRFLTSPSRSCAS